MDTWTGILIELVQQRPCLWQKSHPNYKDSRIIKKNNWIDVTEALKERTGKDIPSKITDFSHVFLR